MKLSALQFVSVPELKAAICRDDGLKTLQRRLWGHAKMISLSLSLFLSVSSPLHVLPALTAYLNHMRSLREGDLIWQPSEKLKDMYT